MSPGVDGYKADTCGDSCIFDAAAAKAAYEAAGGYEGTLTMTYNADAPNKAWSEAVCNSIKNTLGLDCVAVPTVDFATYNKKIDAERAQGHLPRRLAGGLPVDRELPDAALRQGCLPAGVQLGLVRQPGVREARWPRRPRRRRLDEANTLYQQAEALLAKDFPTAPLWYNKTTAAWSDRVTDVQVNAFGVLDFSAIKVK